MTSSISCNGTLKSSRGALIVGRWALINTRFDVRIMIATQRTPPPNRTHSSQIRFFTMMAGHHLQPPWARPGRFPGVKIWQPSVSSSSSLRKVSCNNKTSHRIVRLVQAKNGSILSSAKPTLTLPHSLTPSLPPSLPHSLTPSPPLPLSPSPSPSLSYSLPPSLPPSLPLSLSPSLPLSSLPYSLTLLLSYSLTLLLSYSLTLLLSYSLTLSLSLSLTLSLSLSLSLSYSLTLLLSLSLSVSVCHASVVRRGVRLTAVWCTPFFLRDGRLHAAVSFAPLPGWAPHVELRPG